MIFRTFQQLRRASGFSGRQWSPWRQSRAHGGLWTSEKVKGDFIGDYIGFKVHVVAQESAGELVHFVSLALKTNGLERGWELCASILVSFGDPPPE